MTSWQGWKRAAIQCLTTFTLIQNVFNAALQHRQCPPDNTLVFTAYQGLPGFLNNFFPTDNRLSPSLSTVSTSPHPCTASCF